MIRNQNFSRRCLAAAGENNCDQRFDPKKARWYVCVLNEKEFRSLLVFDGDRQISRWPDFSGGSFRIGEVAQGVMNYNNHDSLLYENKLDVLEYESCIGHDRATFKLCLVRTKNGPLTLFESNRRTLAAYIHSFNHKRSPLQSIEAIVAEVEEKLPLQAQ